MAYRLPARLVHRSESIFYRPLATVDPAAEVQRLQVRYVAIALSRCHAGLGTVRVAEPYALEGYTTRLHAEYIVIGPVDRRLGEGRKEENEKGRRAKARPREPHDGG